MSTLMYLVLFLAFWSFLTTNAEDPYRFYTWNITYGSVSPHNTSQPVIRINGLFPGPEIQCVTNDNIVVNVFNNLNESFLITWNGIKQRKNSWQDGVLGTNCPIPPGKNWTYKFQTKDQIGTYSYFASIGMQKAVVYGVLNVWARDRIPIPYPTPESNVSLLIGDWYYHSYKMIESILDSGKGRLPVPVALLINGQSQFNFTGDHGKTYMFRVTNVGLQTSINFRIQNHTLQLVEVEGSHVMQNFYTSLDLYVGQSMTVLVNMSQPSNAAYYILASSTFSNTSLTVTGVLRYSNSPKALPIGPLPEAPNGNISWSMAQARSIRWNLTANAARPNPQGSFHYGTINITRTIVLENSPHVINGKQRYALNNKSYINPETCLKLADYFKIPGVFNLNFTENASAAGDYKQGTYLIPANLHEFFEIILQNNGNALESYHFDGYDFWVPGFGTGEWTNKSKTTYNLIDAFTRHTVQVYPKSWTAILLSLDNEGMWNIRSGLWPRQYLGQQTYMRVYNPNRPESYKTEYPIPNNALQCGKAVGK